MQDQFVAVKAIIEHEGKIFLLRERAYSDATNVGKWDVPGDRVAIGEPYQIALRREVQQEVGLDVSCGRPVWVDEWAPVIQGKPRQIIGIYFHCVPKSTDIRLSEEHDDFRWVTIEDAKALPLMSTVLAALTATARQGSIR